MVVESSQTDEEEWSYGAREKIDLEGWVELVVPWESNRGDGQVGRDWKRC